ncbi:MAG TPA: HrcA family transcriptional regulator, partial [Thermoanaerobaculia bacterium]|nr:HrcA family transcriptional regulator [Thermoanaerobaculia bacterium]
LIETRDDHSSADLDEASRRLTQDFAGLSLREIRARLLETLAVEKSRFDAAFARALDLGRRAFDDAPEAEGTLFVEGTENILKKPEFQGDLEALRRMFGAFDERARLVRLLFDCLETSAPRVVIGSEDPLTNETGSSVVSAPYRYGDRVVGAVAVVGPKRMEYARIVPIVDLLGRYLSARLTESAA